MAPKIGLVGKPSVGKSSFFNVATMNSVPEAEYPFTTVEPNVGEAYVRVECPAEEFGKECEPNTGFCRDNTRYVPVKLVDVAGLIPGAHKGKGLGNKFLSDLNEADVLVHVVDFSGNKDIEGEPAEDHDPREDIDFLEEELDMWYVDILEKGLNKFERQRHDKEPLENVLQDQMSAMGVRKSMVKKAISEGDMGKEPDRWDDEDVKFLASYLRKKTKPMVIAANKMDLEEAKKNYREIKKEDKYEHLEIIPVSVHAERALKKADEKNAINYLPGSKDFEIKKDLSEKQKKGLENIRSFLESFEGTGVQKVLEKAVFDELDLVPVFPVGSEGLTDKEGNVLPDCFLVHESITAKDFAFKVHSDLGENFLHAVDKRTGRKKGADSEIKDGDILEIVSTS